jgi:hypothetical protein
MVSYWKAFRGVDAPEENLEVVCRLPDASELEHVYVSALDLRESWKVKPRAKGEKITITIPRHGKGTAIILSAKEDSLLEAEL